LITVPTISNGATAMAAMSRDIGFGVIISSTITEAIQSVAKTTEKSKSGTRNHHSAVEMAVIGANAAPII